MEKINKTADKFMAKVALPLIFVAGALLIVLMVGTGNSTNKENNAYVRVINCIVSYPASTRTQDDIEQCYLTVENDLDVTLQRYDSSNK